MVLLDEVEYTSHFGVYGVSIQDGKLLCIFKNSGSYQNRFDLPGGSQETGEGLTETLVREVFEETGQKVRQYSHPRIYDAFVQPVNQTVCTHHVFALYTVELENEVNDIPSFVIDGANDSDGTAWVSLSELNESNSSPLILKVLEERDSKKTAMEKSRFKEWKIQTK